jgi:AraC family transcriptional regulator of adaptative response / DNA-3-methyladenine glycosylase II
MFVPTAAAAQTAGYRPCLRCRPESSPELDSWRGTEATVSRAMKLIEEGALDSGDVASLAERLEIGERQLRRLFSQHIGAAPIAVAQTRRILLAKQLIHQTDLPMIDVALASGFGSVRRFNEVFRRMYHRPPTELRRRTVTKSAPPEITILLPYRPPYDWPAMLRFLGDRAIAGVEVVENGIYRRTIELDSAAGTIEVAHAPKQKSLQVTVRFPRLSALAAIIARLRRQFDLGADPAAIASVLRTDPLLAPLVAARPGLRVPGGWDGFEIAVRAVIGQQITVKSATQLLGKLVATLGTELAESSSDRDLTHLFPRPEQFTPKGLAKLGMPGARRQCLANFAQAAIADTGLFAQRRDLEEAVAQLRQISGVGQWTAQYIAMRALGESDAFLAGDVALERKLAELGRRPTARALLARAENWRPWRAYAVLHLWMADKDHVQTISRRKVYDALTA